MMKQVESADGTSIAFETTGAGPPLVLVGGAFCDRHAKAAGTPFAAHLARRFTVLSYDRRGRGDSGDTPPWTIEREVEDLAAILAAAGGRALVYGISSGALLALEAAVRGLPIDRLALYEPPIVLDPARQPSVRLADEVAALAASGRRSEAAELFLTRAVGTPAPAVAGMKQLPMWRGLEALAHTLGHDVRISAGALALVERAASLRTPTLLLVGGASPAWIHEGVRKLAAALPDGRYRSLDGQIHDVDPAVLAGVLIEELAARG
jgi:pimeloyl-ACP methyl ester carboxylesterase